MDHSAHAYHHQLLSLPASPNALDWAGFAAIFSYSFLVSFHCLGMCGPLACSILSKNSLSPWKSTLLYNTGRGLSYSAAGALSAFLVGAFSTIWPGLTRWISVALGALVCIWALSSFFGWKRRLAANAFAPALRSLQSTIIRLPASASALGLGILTIFLPCMTLHPLLLVSASHDDPLAGAITMLAFFAGTLPVMVSATYMPTLIGRGPQMLRFVRFGQIFLFIAGLLTIARGFVQH